MTLSVVYVDCVQAGQIPKEGYSLNLAGYNFLVSEVEDNRRIITLAVSKIDTDLAPEVGSVDDTGKSPGQNKVDIQPLS